MKAFFFMQFLLFKVVLSEIAFTYNGFKNANLSLDGDAYLWSNGILGLTHDKPNLIGHALYPSPLQFRQKQSNDSNRYYVPTFSTTFVFAINPKHPEIGGHGIAFALLSNNKSKGCLANQYLGLPNVTSMAKYSTRVLAVEFDVVQSLNLTDIDDNHVGIDISSLISNISKPAGYYLDNTTTPNTINLKNGKPVQVWIDFNSQEMLLNVTIAPLGTVRPHIPLICFPVDLSLLLDDYMYAGFTASTGLLSASQTVLGWSFRIGGKAQDLNSFHLPSLDKPVKVVHTKGFIVGITLATITLAFMILFGVLHTIHHIRTQEDILEYWEVDYGACRFNYSELVAATNGFNEKNLIGCGGFGKVYKGVIPSTGLVVAIKRIAQDSRQGMREFVAEITSMRGLRHRNLVQLHGWCRRQDELHLVYDYVSNGSLDDLLFNKHEQEKKLLTWQERFKILTGVAHALLYLHEESEQMVVHRDVKPSNVLIDADLTAKLGDFGLSRTYGHGLNPQTTHIVGTVGYLAPELTKTGKATTCTDVYGYGALMLEVACGRRPIEPQRISEELVLVDWVRELHSKGEILRAVDPNLEEYNQFEAELVLSLGLLCAHPNPVHRPSMRSVVQVLLGNASLPMLPSNLHLENAGVITNYSVIYEDDFADSSDIEPSSQSTSFSRFNKLSSDKRATSVTL
ncbi:Protein kinase domain-containing protein [Heracleum sosnowskyi]|uniref:non-specific serine/threonine protein kinase n=1 Tax=Heracleum sosnowskyi TaxID=360622 RepID=A0AAD8MUP9_9APIA|nr:Protein kinase domain-containing protein [Heracleum sosnowskyi]